MNMTFKFLWAGEGELWREYPVRANWLGSAHRERKGGVSPLSHSQKWQKLAVLVSLKQGRIIFKLGWEHLSLLGFSNWRPFASDVVKRTSLVSNYLLRLLVGLCQRPERSTEVLKFNTLSIWTESDWWECCNTVRREKTESRQLNEPL